MDCTGRNDSLPSSASIFKQNSFILACFIIEATTMVFALVSNALLAGIIVRSSTGPRKKWVPVQILILHSCISDLCYAFLSLLPQVIRMSTLPYFYGGAVMCKLVAYLSVLPFYVSPFLLVAISIDRFLATKKPFFAVQHKHKTHKVLAVAAWIGGSIFTIPQFFIFEMNCNNICTMSHFGRTYEFPYTIYFALIAWVIPSIFSGSFYYFVVKEVFRSANNLKMVNKFSGATMPSVQSTVTLRRYGLIPRSLEQRRYRERDKDTSRSIDSISTADYISVTNGGRNSLMTDYMDYRKNRTSSSGTIVTDQVVKTVKLTLTIVVTNFLLYAPFCMANMLKSSGIIKSRELTTMILLVGNCNSCVNPWIYIAYNRSQVMDILRCRQEKSLDAKQRAFYLNNKGKGPPKSCRPSRRLRRSERSQLDSSSPSIISNTHARLDLRISKEITSLPPAVPNTPSKLPLTSKLSLAAMYSDASSTNASPIPKKRSVCFQLHSETNNAFSNNRISSGMDIQFQAAKAPKLPDSNDVHESNCGNDSDSDDSSQCSLSLLTPHRSKHSLSIGSRDGASTPQIIFDDNAVMV